MSSKLDIIVEAYFSLKDWRIWQNFNNSLDISLQCKQPINQVYTYILIMQWLFLYSFKDIGLRVIKATIGILPSLFYQLSIAK